MKKKILNGIFTLLLVVFGAANVSAGEIKKYNQEYRLGPAGCEDEEEEINQQAIKAFKKMFSFATRENWYKVSDGYIVKFQHEGIQYRAGYDAKGRWINTVKSYDASKLSPEIGFRVKAAYFDYTIVFVEEVILPYDMGYVIHLENDASIKKVVVTDMDSDIQVMESYHRK